MNNNKTDKLLLRCVALFVLIFQSINGFAQTENVKNLGDKEVTIVKEYQPVLNDVFKISLTPQGDTSTSLTSVLKYDVDPQQMISNYNITPIKPVKIKDETIKKLYHGFVKAGYGNYNTPLLDVSYNTLRSKSFDAGVKIKHESSSGAIKDYGYPGFRETQIGLTGTKFFDKNMLDADINYSRDVYHFYGYKKSSTELFTRNETKHLFSDVAANFIFSDNNSDKDAIKYKAAFSIYNFRDNNHSDESGEVLSGYFGKNIGDGLLKVNFIADLNQTQQSKQDLTRNIFTLEPLYYFKWKLLSVIAGVNSSMESNNTDLLFHLYPNVEAKYMIIDDAFSVFAKWGGGMKKNTFKSISKENQFLDSFTSFKNTNDKLNLSLGAFAKLSHDVNANATVRYSRLTNELFFVNEDLDPTKSPVKFTTLYDDVDLIAIHGQLDYRQAENTTVGLNIDFNSYNPDNLSKPLFKPLYRIGLSGKYIIADKIEIKPDIYFNGNSYAFDYRDTISNIPKFQTIKGFVDLSIGVEYHYTKILNVFVQINNIAMSRQFYWNKYPSYRLNAMVGITYSFL